MQKFGLLGSLVILVALFASESNAEFYWKNNKIVRAYELNNEISTPQDFSTTVSELNTINTAAVPQQVQVAESALDLLQTIKFDCTGKPTGPNKDTKYCDIYHACVFGKQSKTYACEQMGERFYYDANLQR